MPEEVLIASVKGAGACDDVVGGELSQFGFVLGVHARPLLPALSPAQLRSYDGLIIQNYAVEVNSVVASGLDMNIPTKNISEKDIRNKKNKIILKHICTVILEVVRGPCVQA